MQPLFLLLDIDNTLYEYSETGFHNEMHDRIFSFAEKKLGISAKEAEELSRKFWMNYGLSLYGYVKEYHVNAKEYSDYVHQCSYEKLKYNKPLVEMLQSMQYTPSDAASHTQTSGVDHLYYFTNANRSHARRVLDPQGLRQIFTRPRPAGLPIKEYHRTDDEDGFEDQVEWLGFSYEDQWRLTQPDFANKPMRRAYEAIYHAIEVQITEDAALLQAGDTAESTAAATVDATVASPSSPNAKEVHSKRTHLHPKNFVMVDDSLMNLDAPLQLGWSAVWYAHDGQTLPRDAAVNASAALYAAAVAAGRLQVIHHILELKAAVERIREVNMKATG
jgi:pyrimidine 5'-nucleotidase